MADNSGLWSDMKETKEPTIEQRLDYLTKANEVLRGENLALRTHLDDAKELLTEVCAQSVSPNHKYGQLIDKIELFLRSMK